MFYVLLARAPSGARGVFDVATQPKSKSAADPGRRTVAEMSRSSMSNNRRLVAQGLRRIRAGQCPLAAALFHAGRLQGGSATTFDFGFALGRASTPQGARRHDAGHRMPAEDHASRAAELAATLDCINRERREIEVMREQAMLMAESLFDQKREAPRPPSAC